MTAYKPLARRTQLIVQDLNDETLIYDQARNQAHSLNRTAAFVWKHSDGTRSPRDLQRLLQTEMQMPVPAEVVDLALDELANHHLLARPRARRAGQVDQSRRDFLKLGLMAALVPVIASITSPVAAGEVSGATGATGATGVTGPTG